VPINHHEEPPVILRRTMPTLLVGDPEVFTFRQEIVDANLVDHTP
jgi:hypothetical protein